MLHWKITSFCRNNLFHRHSICHLTFLLLLCCCRRCCCCAMPPSSHLPFVLSVHLPVFPSLSVFLSGCPSIIQYVCLSFCQSVSPSVIHLSACLFVCPSLCLSSVFLPVRLSSCLPDFRSICRSCGLRSVSLSVRLLV